MYLKCIRATGFKSFADKTELEGSISDNADAIAAIKEDVDAFFKDATMTEAAKDTLKEIQEWLGHSDFSTTANVYSHLDFSFKIKAANTILSAYSDEQPIVKKESELSLLEKASQEMKALGFTSIEEYLAYKAK